MRILLINPPHQSIGSRIPLEHLPPLGLLSVGGPLIDAKHKVELLDAEFGPMPLAEIVTRTILHDPDAILLSHSGSTSGHPIVAELTRALRRAMPDAWIVYGGRFPDLSLARDP
jgi:anaerobic magnesium-protoporphyrin IX monomethyl ester cyclase